jgi:hypothetical protein
MNIPFCTLNFDGFYSTGKYTASTNKFIGKDYSGQISLRYLFKPITTKYDEKFEFF